MGGKKREKNKKGKKSTKMQQVYFLVVSLGSAGLKAVLTHGVNNFLQKPHKS